MSWIGVCDAEQVQEDFPYSGNIDGKEIGIYLIDGEYYALEDVCPHAYALLSQGFVEDGKVECPLHEAVFDVKTGQCLHGPGGRNLNRYPVRVYDNQIQITFIAPIQLIAILQAFVSYMKLCFLFNTVNIKAVNVSSSINVTNLLMSGF